MRAPSITEVEVFAYLVAEANREGVAEASMNAVALHIGRSTASVSNAIQKLKQRGAIERINRGHRLSKGVYRLLAKSVQWPSKPTGISEHPRSVQDLYKSTPTPANMGMPIDPTPDVYRSNAFGVAGRLHLKAPKEKLITLQEILGLDVIRTRATVLKHVAFLSALPDPLANVSDDPTHGSRKLYTFHPMTREREESLWAYLASIPNGAPLTMEEQAQRVRERQGNYARWLKSGGLDPERLWAEVEPTLMDDHERPGCRIPSNAELNGQGYSILQMGRVTMRVHRLAWEAQCGRLSFGEELHHRCGNRACVEVFHLEPVTREQHLAIHRGI